MPFVVCSVDGCTIGLQPFLKPDPRDRETWLYRECDECFRPVCKKHSTEVAGQVICDRCRREFDARAQQPGLIDLNLKPRPEADEAGRDDREG